VFGRGVAADWKAFATDAQTAGRGAWANHVGCWL
jgi:hypothetical protein